MAFMVAVICANCVVTAELELVRTALACASPSISLLCVCIPWVIVFNLSIALWCYYGGGGGTP